MTKVDNITKGKFGEKLALKHLKKLKYKILEVNYTNKIGEIDIIAKDKETIVFIEVKTRSSCKFGFPKESITYSKINKIKTTAISYLKYKGLYEKNSVRFDCIEIVGDQLDYDINHIQNIF